MKPEFTSTGLDVQTYEEIFEDLVDGYKAIYGSDISVDSDDPDGQRIGIEATNLLDVQSFASYLYSSLDPDFASGAFLDVILKYSGLYRRPASRSQWDLSVTVSIGTTLPDGYTVKDDLGQEWELDGSEILVTGANTITFVASDYGAVEGISGATIEQVTFDPLVTSITASANSTVGIEEETNQAVRDRRNKSLLNPAYSTTGGLLSKILNLPAVTDAVIYENDDSSYDATLNLDAHALWIIIEGGSNSDITETIVKSKTSGTPLKGSVENTYTETIVKPDTTTVSLSRVVRYDRPVDADIYVNVSASRKDPTSAIDVDAIKASIAGATYSIGVGVVASELYANGYEAGSNFILFDLEVSDDDVVYTDSSIAGTAGYKYSIVVANVTVTEV